MPGEIRLKPTLDPVDALIKAASGSGPGEAPEGGSGKRQGPSVMFLGIAGLAVLSLLMALASDRGPLIDRFLNSLRAFTDGFPGAGEPGDSPWLTLSKHLAAIAAFFGVVILLYSLYRDAFDRRRASLRRGHVVVCGLDEKGLRSARAFRAAGDDVTCIDMNPRSDAGNELRTLGAVVLAGDPTERQMLATARVDRARAVVCASDDDSVNVAIAARVKELIPPKSASGPVDVFAHIKNPELARLLDVRTLGIQSIRLQFFNVYELWAQAFTEAIGLDRHAADDPPPRILVVGSTDLGRAAVTWFARRWHSLDGTGDRKLEITLVAEDAATQCAALTRRFPAIERTVQLTPIDQAVNVSSQVDLRVLPPAALERVVAVCACLPEDVDNLVLALQARHHLPDHVRVVVPESAWTGDFESLLLDPLDPGQSGQITTVRYSSEPRTLDLLEFSRVEIMAREIHADYLAGEASEQANMAWEDLTNPLRDSNRNQAHGIVRHFRAIWYELEALFDWSAPVVELSELEVEELAELEHLRWCDEKRRAGFVPPGPGPAPPGTKTRPDLVDWYKLPEPTREKNRRAACRWPEILARVGFGLDRSSLREELAREIHARHRTSRLAAGETLAERPALLPWEELSADQRAPSLAGADDIGVKLARIRCELVPLAVEAEPFEFTPEEVEYLAELEHDRWCRQRLATGWRFGETYDETARTHPDLVTWAELSDDRRQIDRDHVIELPELMAGISRRIVRYDPGSPS